MRYAKKFSCCDASTPKKQVEDSVGSVEYVPMTSMPPVDAAERIQKILNKKALNTVTEYTRNTLHVNIKTLHFLQTIIEKYDVQLKTSTLVFG